MGEPRRLLDRLPGERAPHPESRERIGLERIRVTAVCDPSTEELATHCADATTRALCDTTATGHPARAMYSMTGDRHLTMHLEYPRSSKSSPDGSALDRTLARSGFTCERQLRAVDPAPRAVEIPLAVPSILVRAGGSSRIGFHPAPDPAPVQIALTPMSWFNLSAVDAALAVWSTSGTRGTLEFELRSRELDGAARDALAALLDSAERGSMRVFDGYRWSQPTSEIATAIADMARLWIGNAQVLVPRVRLSANIAPSLEPALRRALFPEHGHGRPMALAPGSGAYLPTIDLAGCVPVGACPRVVPTQPAILRLLGPVFPRPPLGRLPAEGLVIGTASSGTAVQEVRVTGNDRQRHVICLGSSGVGKSTLIARMIGGDIAAGDGVCVIDPHGELCARVIERIPPDRIRDVIWLRPGLDGRTFGLNLLEHRPGQTGGTPAALCNELFRIFDRLYDMNLVAGPIFEQYMRSAAALVLENTRPGGTLLDIVRLFEHDDYREELIETCTNPVVADFWRTTAVRATGELSLRSVAPYITSKLNQFVTNASMRAIVAQSTSTIDFRAAMDRRAIILLDLSVGSLGVGEVQLLGMLALCKLFAAAMERVADASGGPQMRVYADEAHLFATETLTEILSQARKGALSFVLATQSLSQLKSSRLGTRLMESVLGNVGTVLAFRVGPYDAELLEPMFKRSLTGADLERLPDYHIACRLLAEGMPLDPFVCRTQPLDPAPPGAARIVRAIRRRARRYTRPIVHVETATAACSKSSPDCPQGGDADGRPAV